MPLTRGSLRLRNDTQGFRTRGGHTRDLTTVSRSRLCSQLAILRDETVTSLLALVQWWRRPTPDERMIITAFSCTGPRRAPTAPSNISLHIVTRSHYYRGKNSIRVYYPFSLAATVLVTVRRRTVGVRCCDVASCAVASRALFLST